MQVPFNFFSCFSQMGENSLNVDFYPFYQIKYGDRSVIYTLSEKWMAVCVVQRFKNQLISPAKCEDNGKQQKSINKVFNLLFLVISTVLREGSPGMRTRQRVPLSTPVPFHRDCNHDSHDVVRPTWSQLSGVPPKGKNRKAFCTRLWVGLQLFFTPPPPFFFLEGDIFSYI